MPEDKISRPAHPAGVQLARGSLVNLAATIVSNLRGIFTFLVARLLGQAALGTYALAFSSIDLLSKVGTFGLDGATTAEVARREAVGDHRGSRQVLRTAIVWGLGLSALTAVIGALGLRWWQGYTLAPGDVVASMRLMLLALPGIMLYRVATGFSRGMHVMRHDLYSRGLAESLVTIAAFLAAVALGLRTWAPVTAVVAGTLAGGLVALYLARGLISGPPARPADGSVTRPLLRMAAPLAVTHLLNALTMRMDVLLLGLFVGRMEGLTIERIGIFSAAVDLAGVMRKLRQVFDPIFMPVVASQLARGDRQSAADSFAQLGRWVLGVQLLLLGVLWTSSGLLLSLLGPGFREGALWVGVLAVAHATNTFVGLGETLIMVQRPALNTVNSAITATVQAAAGIAFIRLWGPLGAAFSTVVAYATQGVLRFVELHALLGWRFSWTAFRTPCIAFLLALVPGLGLRWWLGPGIGELSGAAAFAAVYIITWRAQGLDEADRAVLAAIRSRRQGIIKT
jgi:O-antigen/teichoic acid export membrane protein